MESQNEKTRSGNHTIKLSPEMVSLPLRQIQKTVSQNVLFGLQSITGYNGDISPHSFQNNEGFISVVVDQENEPLEIRKERCWRWLITKGIEDLIKGAILSLNDAHIYGSIVNKRNEIKTIDAYNHKFLKVKRKVGRLGLPDLLGKLKPFLRDDLAHAEKILSINKVRNCLVHRDGIVELDDLNDKAKRTLSLKYLGFKLTTPHNEPEKERTAPFAHGGQVEFGIVERTKEFKLGENIKFTYGEFGGILITFSFFVKDLEFKMIR